MTMKARQRPKARQRTGLIMSIGRRLKAVRYGAETHYVYDASGNLLAETDNNNNITKYYIYGAGLLAMVDATTGNIYCYHF